VHLSPGVIMSSNLHLFREMRLTDTKSSEASAKLGAAISAAS